MLQYILECIAFQLAFLIIYDFLLKKETFFQWNRAYLIGTYIVSLVLPWVKIQALASAIPEQYVVYPAFFWQSDISTVAVIGTAESNFQFSWQEGVLYTGMFLAALYFAFKLYKIAQLRKQGTTERFPNFTRIVVKNSELAFSFFKSVFLGDKLLSQEYKSIIAHELVHIQQRHSLDLVFFELMRIVGWFNPLVYVYQNRIAELHEFIADAQVPKTERKAHYNLLLSQVFQTQNISFINQFYKKSLIKKRIVMLQKAKSRSIFQLKYVLLLPLVFGMLLYSSCELISPKASGLHKNFVVANLEELPLEKANFLFDELIALATQTKAWSMEVKDNNSTVSFSKAPKGSGISGPSGVMIPAKMHIASTVLKEDFDFFKFNNAQTGQIIIQTGVTAFAEVDEVPVFPGCEDEADKRACFNKMMQRHIANNFSYPLAAQEQGIQGRVNILLTVGVDGTIQNLKMRGPDPILENEAKRIVDLLPKLTPGKENGKKVNVAYSIPITFKLASDFESSIANSKVPENGFNLSDPYNAKALYFVDGIETPVGSIHDINPNTIESMSVFKGKAAIDKYGAKGENGIVEISLKK